MTTQNGKVQGTPDSTHSYNLHTPGLAGAHAALCTRSNKMRGNLIIAIPNTM